RPDLYLSQILFHALPTKADFGEILAKIRYASMKKGAFRAPPTVRYFERSPQRERPLSGPLSLGVAQGGCAISCDDPKTVGGQIAREKAPLGALSLSVPTAPKNCGVVRRSYRSRPRSSPG